MPTVTTTPELLTLLRGEALLSEEALPALSPAFAALSQVESFSDPVVTALPAPGGFTAVSTGSASGFDYRLTLTLAADLQTLTDIELLANGEALFDVDLSPGALSYDFGTFGLDLAGTMLPSDLPGALALLEGLQGEALDEATLLPLFADFGLSAFRVTGDADQTVLGLALTPTQLTLDLGALQIEVAGTMPTPTELAAVLAQPGLLAGTLTLIAPDGTQTTATQDGEAQDATLNGTADQAGTYTLQVSGPAAGWYELFGADFGPSDRLTLLSEGPDAPDTGAGRALPDGAFDLTGQLETGADIDRMSVTLQDGEAYFFALSSGVAPLNTTTLPGLEITQTTFRNAAGAEIGSVTDLTGLDALTAVLSDLSIATAQLTVTLQNAPARLTQLAFTPEGAVPVTVAGTDSFVFEVEPGVSGRIAPTLAHDREIDAPITAGDALEVLRLAVGLSPRYSETPDGFDFLRADVNGDGQVTAGDALELLRYAVGLETDAAPRWIALAADADLSGLSKDDTRVDSGAAVDPLSGNASLALQMVLIGNLEEVI